MHDGCCHHHHHHGMDAVSSPEEANALLKYMTEHNKNHLKELEEIMEQFDDSVKELIKAAAESYELGNRKLTEALAALEK